MFENSGSIIKTLAKVVFVFSIIAGVVLGAVLGKNRYGEFDFLSFAAILIGIGFSGFISAVFLYAFGDMTENVKRIADNSMAMQMARSAAAGSSETAGSGEKASYLDYWVCRKCGSRNLTSKLSCKDCGTYRN